VEHFVKSKFNAVNRYSSTAFQKLTALSVKRANGVKDSQSKNDKQFSDKLYLIKIVT
jgi:hypothetical protein